MKTAEEMLDEHYENLNGNASDIIVAIKQIQLDAMREGMRRAAEIAEARHGWRNEPQMKHILSAAEQLTEKDLSVEMDAPQRTPHGNNEPSHCAR